MIRNINKILALFLLATCLGCATTSRIDVQSAIKQAKEVFKGQDFVLIDLKTESKGLIADVTSRICIHLETKAWEANNQRLADAMKVELSKTGNFAVTGADDAKTVQVIKRAFELCKGIDLTKLNFAFVGSAELQATIKSIVEKSGATFLFKEYKP